MSYSISFERHKQCGLNELDQVLKRHHWDSKLRSLDCQSHVLITEPPLRPHKCNKYALPFMQVYTLSHRHVYRSVSSNYNRANDVAVWPCVCGKRLLERLMPPSPKSPVMFASAFSSVIVFVFLAFIVFTLRPLCWIYEYACELMQLTVVVGADWTLHRCMR